MIRFGSPILLMLAAALAAPQAAFAQPYKWVDERGVVNYGDAPPADARNVRRLDLAGAPLSVVPGLSRDVIERERERTLQAQLAELQREVEHLRARASTPVVVPVTVVHESPVIVAHPLRPHGHRFDRTRPRPPRDAPVRGQPVQRLPAAMRADLPGRAG
ncbi:MAG: hypothetical protein OHK0044_30150 [Burkholderiaceae bacterium]